MKKAEARLMTGDGRPMPDDGPRSAVLSPRSSVTSLPELFITDDPQIIAELHAQGQKEIAIRDGREYVFRLQLTEDRGQKTDSGLPSSVAGQIEGDKDA